MQPGDDNADDSKELARINEEIGQAERDKKEEKIRDYLSDDLIFLRASGRVASKQDYLDGLALPENWNTQLSWDAPVITIRNDHALVVVNVTLAGMRGGNPVDGVFRNFRTFMRQKEGWRLVTWANYQITNNIT
ncbi:MAG TPA: nuclear transport factor 2 family protein [Chloroflexia bacterium]|jgi:ketosteroid isomerase-like protein|nr:nuclear transport factor 2 family protein [Chloroflexia bacterium]